VRPEGFSSRATGETGFVSDDGKWFIFSISNYAAAPFKYGTSAVFLRNLLTSTTFLVSPTVGNYTSDPYLVFGLSADGTWAVLYEASAGFQMYNFDASGSVVSTYPILVDKNGTVVFEPITVVDSVSVPQFSADGRFFLFTAETNRLDSLDTNTLNDVYLYDRIMNKTMWISNFEGRDGYDNCYGHALSSNGRFAAFRCNPAMSSGNYDITVVMDLSNGQFWNTNVNESGDAVTTEGILVTAISNDGVYATHDVNSYYSNITRATQSIIAPDERADINSLYQLMTSSGTILHVIQNLTNNAEWRYLQYETSTGELSVMTELSCQYEDQRFCDLFQYRSGARVYGLSMSGDGSIVLFSNRSVMPVYFNTSSNLQSPWMLSPGSVFDGVEAPPNYRTALNEDGSLMAASRITSSQTGCTQALHVYNPITQTTTAIRDVNGNCVTPSETNDIQIVQNCVVFVSAAIMFDGDDSAADLYCYNASSGNTSVLALQDGNVDPTRPISGGYVSSTF
jgi:hypothetical protein